MEKEIKEFASEVKNAVEDAKAESSENWELDAAKQIIKYLHSKEQDYMDTMRRSYAASDGGTWHNAEEDLVKVQKEKNALRETFLSKVYSTISPSSEDTLKETVHEAMKPREDIGVNYHVKHSENNYFRKPEPMPEEKLSNVEIFDRLCGKQEEQANVKGRSL